MKFRTPIKRDSLLVTHQQFTQDLQHAYNELKKWNIRKKMLHYFSPPYEWYNDSIAKRTQMGLQLVDLSPEPVATLIIPIRQQRYNNEFHPEF